jgi:hypothetical protein
MVIGVVTMVFTATGSAGLAAFVSVSAVFFSSPPPQEEKKSKIPEASITFKNETFMMNCFRVMNKEDTKEVLQGVQQNKCREIFCFLSREG